MWNNAICLVAGAALLVSSAAAQPQDLVALKAQAGAGNLAAMVKLGQAHAEGAGVPQNYADAMRWFRAAADKGSSAGMVRLGQLYFDGKGVTKDYAEALKWHRASAAKGNAEATWYVGMAYLIGAAVPKNPAEAVRWFRMSAAKGDPRGQNSLAEMLRTGSGVARDPAAALKLYRLSADQGNATALYNMANMFREGLGVPKDEEEAYRLREAAKSADPKKWRTFKVGIAPATLVAPPAASAPAQSGRYPYILNRGSAPITLTQNYKQICVMAPGQSCGQVFVADASEVHFFAVVPSGAHDSFYRQYGRDVPVHLCIDEGPVIRGC